LTENKIHFLNLHILDLLQCCVSISSSLLSHVQLVHNFKFTFSLVLGLLNISIQTISFLYGKHKPMQQYNKVRKD